ncbi:MAG: hypothetical protein AAF577_03445 [Pseudomonadota bacterium]
MADLAAHAAFASTALGDAALTAIRIEGGSLFLQVELPLLPGHPDYTPPPRGERHCLAVCLLSFRGLGAVTLKLAADAARPAADGSVEFSGIDSLMRQQGSEQGDYTVAGGWGSITLQAKSLDLRMEGDQPGAAPRPVG